MKINKKTIQKMGIATLVMSGILLIANAALAAETAVWTTVSVTGSITENVSLNVDEELRFGDISGPSLVRQHTDLSVSLKVNDLVSTITGYRNTSTGEHRPYVGLGLALLRGDLSLDSSTKLELRELETIRGRTELTASADVSGVSTWLTEEVFVDSTGITGNRASIGVTKGINKTFGVSAYYLLDTAGTDFGNSTHVLGLGLGVSL